MSAMNAQQQVVKQESNACGQLTKLYDIITDIVGSGFYGSLEVKFEAGKISLVRKTESIKL